MWFLLPAKNLLRLRPFDVRIGLPFATSIWGRARNEARIGPPSLATPLLESRSCHISEHCFRHFSAAPRILSGQLQGKLASARGRFDLKHWNRALPCRRLRQSTAHPASQRQKRTQRNNRPSSPLRQYLQALPKRMNSSVRWRLTRTMPHWSQRRRRHPRRSLRVNGSERPPSWTRSTAASMECIGSCRGTSRTTNPRAPWLVLAANSPGIPRWSCRTAHFIFIIPCLRARAES